MPETSGETVPGDRGRAEWRRTARKAGDSLAYGDGQPAAAGRGEGRGSAARSAWEAASDDRYRARPAAQVLADRLAVALAHHVPGWRLPRPSVLARRYDVSTAQVDAAISELVSRHLLRRLPDGQVHRVSPAEYLIPLEGVPGLRSRIDPMAGELTCQSRKIAWRRVPEDIGWALQVDPTEQVCVVHTVWTTGGEPAASAITYMPTAMTGVLPDTAPPGDQVAGAPLGSSPELAEARWDDLASMGEPAALQVEMQQPPPSTARSLRLSAGQPAAMVTVRFDDPATGRPAALTLAVLRPELFRIVVQTAEMPLPGDEEGCLRGAWTAADWESLSDIPAPSGRPASGPGAANGRSARATSGGFGYARTSTGIPA